MEKWVESSVPDSPLQRASETTEIGTVGGNERSELHRLFGQARWWQERGWLKNRGDNANVRIRSAIRIYGQLTHLIK